MYKNYFSLNPDIIYFNHAAVAPWPKQTCAAVKRFADENAAYGASHYPHWMSTELELRKSLQRLISADSQEEIALLKSTSEALSVIASGLDWQAGDNIVSFVEEFPSNRIVWQSLETQGVRLRCSSIEEEDAEEALLALCDEHTRLISISSVQYASGFRADLQQIGQFCHENNILFCVDAIQSLAVLPLDVNTIKADFVVADGHKWMLGAEGLALFYCRAKRMQSLKLHQFGWHMIQNPTDFNQTDWQPHNSAQRFECGSPNMLGIHALQASLSLIEQVGLENISRNILINSQYLIDYIINNNRLELLSPGVPERLSGIVNFRILNSDQDKIFQKMQQQKLVCALRGGGIRFSPHFYQNSKDIDRAIKLLEKIV
ncbi:MAG: aminotransferase class V-fold PLP-dependent enzyme [gamma proteobacterium symbiont of Bathyaustriella thionipta]|nr:aminotransferase class V-fold PLP-dependent enzyme [gamma proteobacterium symbiont of Bathyaustriella thionipta]